MERTSKVSWVRRPFHIFNHSTREGIKFSVKFSILFVGSFIALWALLEVKRYYNIDVIPGYDSPVDDAYGAARGTIVEFFK